MPRFTRRRFIGLAAAGLSAVTLGGLAARREEPAPVSQVSGLTTVTPAPVPIVPPTPTATPVPEPPVMPRGREDIRLMAGSEWETRGLIWHSGRRGPRFMTLGGVHGNEPGGWLAAESIADWKVDRGMLIVLPRVNWRAAAAFTRTVDGAGDLNRLYPGDPDGLPMARMAAEITALATSWRPHWFWDMHESWGFWNERGENSGTAFIGQTLTIADPERQEEMERLVGYVNEQLTEREQMMMRVRRGGVFRRDGFSPTGRGRSSLSIGTTVPGVSAVLVEMGQMDQPEARRSEIHQLFVRSMLEHLGAV